VESAARFSLFLQPNNLIVVGLKFFVIMRHTLAERSSLASNSSVLFRQFFYFKFQHLAVFPQTRKTTDLSLSENTISCDISAHFRALSALLYTAFWDISPIHSQENLAIHRARQSFLISDKTNNCKYQKFS
jgi:hypothetical protein